MKPAPVATPRPTGHREAFAFVQELAAELNRGTVDLPSFPDIALRVRQVLADDSVSTEQVVRVINSEPALAAQLLRISNSRPMNSSGRPHTDLRTAVARMGFNMVRSAAIGFAMAQLKRVEGLKGLEQPLDQLWRRSAAVAAMCYVVARRHTRVNADSALLAGMLHGIGKLYILTRSAKHPRLFNDPASLNEVIRDWSAPIAKALLENWSMPAEIVTAVSEFEDHGREHDGPVDLTDVLTVSSMLAVFKQWPAEIELNLQDVRACARMHMDMAAYERLISESDTELDALHQALGM
ncbi:MAG TPA: HDOD domain-containing protein [Steroidobacteraceae bacterium]|nr:HDOD domain-containing protein [Candidatus Dormibacteraeota bacterium]HYM26639.1 HDOD domain-containing protein [Steroidobacteraceae bacterium]